jgi:hypothetical protein
VSEVDAGRVDEDIHRTGLGSSIVGLSTWRGTFKKTTGNVRFTA